MEFINWTSDTQNVIENDEKEFHSLLDVEDNAANKADFNDDNFSVSSQQSQHPHRLDVSWGRYFAQRSPPMGDLGGSHGIYPRPQFHGQHHVASEMQPVEEPRALLAHHNVSSIQEEKEPEEEDRDRQESRDADKHETEMKVENVSKDIEQQPDRHHVDSQHEEEREITSTEMEHEMVMINNDDISITKSMEQLNMEELAAQYFSNRDSNSTLKSEKSSDSQRSNNRFIQIGKKIKHIQRFYQFTIATALQQSSEDEEHMEKQMEAIMLQYIASVNQSKRTAELSAVTYEANTKRCTALILFEREANDNDNEEW
eukprot:CAMPEP_0197026434 /NCGR_PEP_ID=MMETSP1384-20130603/6519_1 /TAXON_ID=29189 /ORGANISM="Ammonia sp." /LENGTH=313 /DNA_ID=CAMNT_0042455095 /DNA_START=55 /DNA_END=993 /DNA_ORIENTATION=-